MADGWTPKDPVTVWALSMDAVPDDLTAGEFLAGVVSSHPSVQSAAGKSIDDAVARHHLRSHPQAVILRMNKSLAEAKSSATGMLVIALVGINLAWLAAVALARGESG